MNINDLKPSMYTTVYVDRLRKDLSLSSLIIEAYEAAIFEIDNGDDNGDKETVWRAMEIVERLRKEGEER